jgi:hypothetical protein
MDDMAVLNMDMESEKFTKPVGVHMLFLGDLIL